MENKKRPAILLFTDGAASGNPGPGGYGAILRCAGREKELSGGFSLTTNNRMELLAVITGLEAIRWDGATVEVWSDSTYVVKAITEGWLESWIRTGFLYNGSETARASSSSTAGFCALKGRASAFRPSRACSRSRATRSKWTV